MNSRTQRTAALRRAMDAAAQLLDQLGIDKTIQIPIFDIAHSDFEEELDIAYVGGETLGKKILGIYSPYGEDGSGAILIHRERPLYLQRFTLAHELGHHVLQHTPPADEQVEPQPLQGAQDTIEEIEAQAFAAFLLMPVTLINMILRRRGVLNPMGRINEQLLRPEDIYELALELGVNYRAAITHLANIERLTWNTAERLRAEEPKAIKQRLRLAQPLRDPWADVWHVTDRDIGVTLFPRIHDLIRLDLPAADLAYSNEARAWPMVTIEREDDADGMEDDAPMGLSHLGTQSSEGYSHLFFAAVAPGRYTIRVAFDSAGAADAIAMRSDCILRCQVQHLHEVD